MRDCALSAVIGVIALRLRQPLIVARMPLGSETLQNSQDAVCVVAAIRQRGDHAKNGWSLLSSPGGLHFGRRPEQILF